MKYRSICHTQQQAIFAMLELHHKGQRLELDPMYNQGEMYNSGGLIKHPLFRFDLDPRVTGCAKADARDLPLKTKSVNSVMLDPPWLISQQATAMTKRYSSFASTEELKTFTQAILQEAYRVLKQDGLLLFKHQDFIDNRRKFFYGYFIIQQALQLGFNPIDEIEIIAPSRQRSQKPGMIQYATHSWHCTISAFRKKSSRNKYTLQVPGPLPLVHP